MKRIWLLVLLLFCVEITNAQKLNWVAPVSQPTGVVATGFRVYKANCTGTVTGTTCSAEGTFAVATNVSSTTLTWTDTAALPGLSYSYYVTTTGTFTPSGGTAQPVESIPSNHAAITVPATVPNPPTLTITSASLIRNGANATLSAAWVDAPGTKTNWMLANGASPIASGTQTSSTQNYSTSWKGKINPNVTGFVFTVCDSATNCVQQSL